jgi:uncharacterized membrane protein
MGDLRAWLDLILSRGQFNLYDVGVCFDYYYPDRLVILGQDYIGIFHAVGLGMLALMLFAAFRKTAGG